MRRSRGSISSARASSARRTESRWARCSAERSPSPPPYLEEGAPEQVHGCTLAENLGDARRRVGQRGDSGGVHDRSRRIAQHLDALLIEAVWQKNRFLREAGGRNEERDQKRERGRAHGRWRVEPQRSALSSCSPVKAILSRGSRPASLRPRRSLRGGPGRLAAPTQSTSPRRPQRRARGGSVEPLCRHAPAHAQPSRSGDT